jgi:hypothetical protein
MIKNQLIAKFHLIKTKTKCCFVDGFSHRYERVLYTDKYNRLFCFYNNDMFVVKPYSTYVEGMETLDCRLGAGYSWYK